jgi:hypothetical protein
MPRPTNLSKIRGCVYPLPITRNLVKHEKRERNRESESAHTPQKMTGPADL